MKFFKTIDGAFKHIVRNSNSGIEKTVNGALMFGMGIYAYADVCTFAGVRNTAGNNAVFCHLNDDEILKMLRFFMNTDRYIVVE